MIRRPWQELTREERALETLALVDLTSGQRQAVIDEWVAGQYPDTPDGERRALNDLVHLMQRATQPAIDPPVFAALSEEDEADLLAKLAEYQKHPSRFAKERAAIRERLHAARMRQ